MENAVRNTLVNIGLPSLTKQRNTNSSGSLPKTFDSILSYRKSIIDSKGLNSSETKSNKSYSASFRDNKLTRDNVKKEELSDTEAKDPLVKTLSDLLGINPGDIIAMLKLSGNDINMENDAGRDKVAQDISGMTGLDSRLQKQLSELINLAADITENQAFLTDKLKGQNNENVAVSPEKLINPDSTSVNDSDFVQGSIQKAYDVILNKQPNTESGELTKQLKEKIEAFLSNRKEQSAFLMNRYLEKEPDSTDNSGDLFAKIHKSPETGDFKGDGAVSNDEPNLIVNAEVKDAAHKSGDKNTSDNSTEGFQENADADRTKQINHLSSDNNDFLPDLDNIAQSGADESSQMQVLQVSTPHSRASFSEITGSSIKTIDPFSNEILSQIVEKASVVLDEGKSEMVLNLKPDNLGKLELKVVTERGIVAANFLAESQQVKEIIESNMQLLKDALEKQGLNVQGFSVSVRQDSGQGPDKNSNDAYNSQGVYARRSNSRNVPNNKVIESLSERINPYSYGYSTIDYIA